MQPCFNLWFKPERCFGVSLHTKPLGRISRISAQKLRLIEDLFTMRNYPYMVLRRAVLRNGPLLSVFTVILSSLQIATTFLLVH